jgi:hypothetical protein
MFSARIFMGWALLPMEVSLSISPCKGLSFSHRYCMCECNYLPSGIIFTQEST